MSESSNTVGRALPADEGGRVGEDVALELDCLGMPCPRPVIELGRHLGDVAVGDVIAVLADDLAAAVDIPAWCRMRGQEYVGASDNRYLVRRLR